MKSRGPSVLQKALRDADEVLRLVPAGGARDWDG